MAKKRWSGFSEAERKAEMEKVRAKIRLTKKQRVDRARKASAAAAIARQQRAHASQQEPAHASDTESQVGQTKKRKRRKGDTENP